MTEPLTIRAADHGGYIVMPEYLPHMSPSMLFAGDLSACLKFIAEQLKPLVQCGGAEPTKIVGGDFWKTTKDQNPVDLDDLISRGGRWAGAAGGQTLRTENWHEVQREWEEGAKAAQELGPRGPVMTEGEHIMAERVARAQRMSDRMDVDREGLIQALDEIAVKDRASRHGVLLRAAEAAVLLQALREQSERIGTAP